ncbi:MAG: hypothetical protein ASARMPRED_002754 [Alectoria sarmentosa]|nr:MAG: hypothetical protein ASARMPRED_002754 [Alectoria sarmentosa]
MPATSASSLIQLVSSAAFRGLLVAPVDHFEERQRQDSSPTPTYLIESLNRFKWLEDIEQDIVPDLTALDLRSPHSQCTANVRDEIEQITGIKDDLMKSVFTVQDLIQDMDILISKVKDIWEQAAIGSMPFFTSSLAYRCCTNFDNRRLSVMLKTQNASHADLVYYSNFSNSIPDLAYDDHINFQTYQVSKSEHGLLTPARAITDARNRMAIANQHTKIQRFEKTDGLHHRSARNVRRIAASSR